ncbi:Clp protease N-terminal domain-containing protein [Streptomyces sp. NPDC059816]|uniref:Clp protease N-terminal domain-containing protein n=1 Tax=Streptomyces sp. NPDC059816 TaxID=3346960 RepID=UPI003660D521
MTSDEGTKPQTQPTTQLGAHWRVAGVLGAAWGSLPDHVEGANTIGTENLLAALTTGRSTTNKALALAGVTATATMAVLRDHHDGAAVWTSTDDVEHAVGSLDLLGSDGDRRRRLSGAAARAFIHAMDLARREGADEYSQEHLLRGVLADRGNRATEMLTTCGATVDDVVRRLDERDTRPADDGLHHHLWPTRDTLLGRCSPDANSLWRRLLLRLARGANLAEAPISWTRIDAARLARSSGGAAGTEHLLLAVLATYEVAQRYPHLALAGPGRSASGAPTAPADRFAGGARLHALGADYLMVRRGVEQYGHELGTDDRDVDTYADALVPGDGTGPLTDALLRGENRARRLLLTLGLSV